MNDRASIALKVAHIKLKIVIFIIVPVVVLTIIASKYPVLGLRSFVVLTGSMQPTIPVGSLLYTQPTVYEKGDIIAFKNGNVVVTHRIIEARNEVFRTKGDANNAIDEKVVQESDILGKSVLVIPYLGRFILFLKTLPGFLIFIVLPTIVFILLEFKNIKKELEKDIEQKLLKKLEKNE